MRAVAPRPLAAASRRRASDLARGPRARPAAAARPRAPRARAASAASAASAAGAVSAASARAGASSSPRADVVPDAFRYAAIASSRAGGGGGGGGGGGAPRVATNAAAAAAASASPSEKKILVAYQGVPGAYSEAAALEAYPTCEPRPCEQFEDAFESTEQFSTDRAVLPFENSLGGSIHRNYDLVLTHRLHIVGEVYFKVRHCLLALPGQEKSALTRALSHPQALSQCDGYLTRLGVVKEEFDDTAGAAAHIQREGLLGHAAIASRRAAELYGMHVYDEDIQDDESNVTRFLALAREPLPPREGVPYKTSIVCSLREGSGALFKALSCFALRDINLTKVESRPMRWNPVSGSRKDGSGGMQFMYLFYVDFDASMADENAQNALRHLQEQTTFFRVLGSYPADDSTLPA